MSSEDNQEKTVSLAERTFARPSPRPRALRMRRQAASFLALRLLGLWVAFGALASPSHAQRGDYLTEGEADRIREAQELLPRTREYLRIATDRIREIGRRSGKEYDIKVPEDKEKKRGMPRWLEKRISKEPKTKAEPKEPENPLEFHTLPNLVNGISQSLGAIMTNIDERVQYKRSDPKEILKSLQVLETYTAQDFGVLHDLKENAQKDKDIDLYKAVRRAEENLERARDGAKAGLKELQPTASPADKPKS
ncbi:MAG TPA: hypothetical protein VGK99_11955 [Acidobacteriota bacterium]|jgi:hypothetical protein